MSGSPKYVVLESARRRAEREAAARRRRAEARERRERARAEARRRARAKAERKEAETAARRAAERQAQLARALADQARAEERALDEVRELIAQSRSSGPAVDLGSLERRFFELRQRLARGERLDGAVEELRAQVVSRGSLADDHDVVPRDAAVTGARAAEQREAAARRAAAEQAAAEQAAAERRAAAERDREAALADSAERLDLVRQAAAHLVDTAPELGGQRLAVEVAEAVRAADEALAAGAAADAERAVAALEVLLPDAERRLDELELDDERRLALVEALREAMLDEGFVYEGGEHDHAGYQLHFARRTGAEYAVDVATDDHGRGTLTYRVRGEPDVLLHAGTDEPVCDTTEALLETVHQRMAGEDGYLAGELLWDGKPPGRRAKRLPGDGGAREAGGS